MSKEMEMDYPQSMDPQMFQWYETSPAVTTRLVPKVKEVSPCSEYTRYTVEGILKDPRGELSALLDVNSMGPIFLNSMMNESKWSSKLGYGMAVVGEDTRIHIHRNGKYIIRRALDRQHAEDTYKSLVHMMKPVIFDELSDRFLWDLIRQICIDDDLPGDIMEMIRWPGDDIDLDLAISEIRKGAREIDEALLSGMRKDLIDGKGLEREKYEPIIEDQLEKTSEILIDEPERSLGRYSASIWGLRALDMISNVIKDPLMGLIEWSIDDLNQRLTDDIGSIGAYQLHYLLSPVIAD